MLYYYDEENHAYFVDGVQKPSVTDIAKPISFERLDMLQKALLEKARARGSRCHEIFEEYLITDEIDWDGIECDYRPYIEQFVLWRRTYRPKVLFTEKRLFGDDFCGTCDLLCKIDGKVVLVDYKVTASADKKSLAVQLAGYRRLLERYGIQVDECYYLHIKKDGFVFKAIEPDDEWFDLLLKHDKKMKEKRK